MLGDANATFRHDNQRRALIAIASERQHVLCVLPTGGGKSLLWLTAVRNYDAPTDVTVVLVPWNVLAANHLATTQIYGISATFYEKDNHDVRQVMYVTPDSAKEDGFRSVVRQLYHFGRLRRIVFDEAHAWLTESDFRPTLLLDASYLTLFEVPIILLSATIPPSAMDAILDRLSITSISRPLTIRQSSTRSTIRYAVDIMPREHFIDHINNLVLRLLPDGYKGIVFTRSRTQADVLAKALDCEAFHGGKTGAQLANSLARWERGAAKIIVATTLLGTGYHTDNVRLIVNHGAPYNYIAYSQSTGRGGRNETYAEA
ncbi:P-loop containing nucleoside triphosphate hydrolase protein, partial [Exidia glandulosa HHB12029]